MAMWNWTSLDFGSSFCCASISGVATKKQVTMNIRSSFLTILLFNIWLPFQSSGPRSGHMFIAQGAGKRFIAPIGAQCAFREAKCFAPAELQSSLGEWFYKHSVPPGLKTGVTENQIEVISYENCRDTTLVNRRRLHASDRRQPFRDRRPRVT